MVPRKSYESALEKALKRSPVVSLLGPRQCGKTTLARMIEKKHGAVFFDLEHLWVVYSGNHIVPLEKKITLVPLDKIETVQGVV
jgi:ABC-type sugar transport system ATPase subunit